MLCTSPWVSGRRLLERNQSCFSVLPVTFFAFTSSVGIAAQQRVGNGPHPKQGIASRKCWQQVFQVCLLAIQMLYCLTCCPPRSHILTSLLTPPDLFWPQKYNIEMKSAKGIRGGKKKDCHTHTKKRWKTNYGNISTAYDVPKNTEVGFA